jgi:ArsR family transcriptional regulator, arsenate/arsenite/antimonite-responsive transcriptional repressor
MAQAALAQSTRLQAFRALVRREPDGIPAGSSPVSLHTLSAHFNVLARAGLVRGERRSRSIIYRADLSATKDERLNSSGSSSSARAFGH